MSRIGIHTSVYFLPKHLASIQRKIENGAHNGHATIEKVRDLILIAHRYGSGITEMEYRRARERNIPCRIYFKDETVPVPPAYLERDVCFDDTPGSFQKRAARAAYRVVFRQPGSSCQPGLNRSTQSPARPGHAANQQRSRKRGARQDRY
jgi:hypothetical protein